MSTNTNSNDEENKEQQDVDTFSSPGPTITRSLGALMDSIAKVTYKENADIATEDEEFDLTMQALLDSQAALIAFRTQQMADRKAHSTPPVQSPASVGLTQKIGDITTATMSPLWLPFHGTTVRPPVLPSERKRGDRYSLFAQDLIDARARKDSIRQIAISQFVTNPSPSEQANWYLKKLSVRAILKWHEQLQTIELQNPSMNIQLINYVSKHVLLQIHTLLCVSLRPEAVALSVKYEGDTMLTAPEDDLLKMLFLVLVPNSRSEFILLFNDTIQFPTLPTSYVYDFSNLNVLILAVQTYLRDILRFHRWTTQDCISPTQEAALPYVPPVKNVPNGYIYMIIANIPHEFGKKLLDMLDITLVKSLKHVEDFIQLLKDAMLTISKVGHSVRTVQSSLGISSASVRPSATQRPNEKSSRYSNKYVHSIDEHTFDQLVDDTEAMAIYHNIELPSIVNAIMTPAKVQPEPRFCFFELQGAKCMNINSGCKYIHYDGSTSSANLRESSLLALIQKLMSSPHLSEKYRANPARIHGGPHNTSGRSTDQKAYSKPQVSSTRASRPVRSSSRSPQLKAPVSFNPSQRSVSFIEPDRFTKNVPLQDPSIDHFYGEIEDDDRSEVDDLPPLVADSDDEDDDIHESMQSTINVIYPTQKPLVLYNISSNALTLTQEITDSYIPTRTSIVPTSPVSPSTP
jgi:hypothetical protein